MRIARSTLSLCGNALTSYRSNEEIFHSVAALFFASLEGVASDISQFKCHRHFSFPYLSFSSFSDNMGNNSLVCPSNGRIKEKTMMLGIKKKRRKNPRLNYNDVISLAFPYVCTTAANPSQSFSLSFSLSLLSFLPQTPVVANTRSFKPPTRADPSRRAVRSLKDAYNRVILGLQANHELITISRFNSFASMFNAPFFMLR